MGVASLDSLLVAVWILKQSSLLKKNAYLKYELALFCI